MNKTQRTGLPKSPPHRKQRPALALEDITGHQEKLITSLDLQPEKEDTQLDSVGETSDSGDKNETNESFKAEVKNFIEISKYFTSPLRKTASYLSDQNLVSYPSTFRLEYIKGSVTTEHIKFCNRTLEPVYVKLFKIIPDLEQIKFMNISQLSRCKRIPPGLSFSLGFVYDDFNEKEPCNAKMIFAASRKTATPCYQICEIELLIDAQKIRRR